MKKRCALDYIDAINAGDVEKIFDLMTPDHLFIDSWENRVEGRDEMKQGWIGYFTWFPDYRIEINKIIEEGSLIVLFGHASATYKNLKNEQNSNYWRVPAVWTAIIEDNKVKQWQVYADNTLAWDIIRRHEN